MKPLTPEHFLRVLEGIHGLLPFGKRPSDASAMLAWQTLPPSAKAALTCEHWTYAAEQFLIDPDRPKDEPIHLAMLRYLFRLENGQPNYTWGLKMDLHYRMANRGQLHPVNGPCAPIALPESADAPPALPAFVSGLFGGN